MKFTSKLKAKAFDLYHGAMCFALFAPVAAHAATNNNLAALNGALNNVGSLLGQIAGPAAGLGAGAVGYTFIASEQGQATKTALRIVGGGGMALGGYGLMKDYVFAGAGFLF